MGPQGPQLLGEAKRGPKGPFSSYFGRDEEFGAHTWDPAGAQKFEVTPMDPAVVSGVTMGPQEPQLRGRQKGAHFQAI